MTIKNAHEKASDLRTLLSPSCSLPTEYAEALGVTTHVAAIDHPTLGFAIKREGHEEERIFVSDQLSREHKEFLVARLVGFIIAVDGSEDFRKVEEVSDWGHDNSNQLNRYLQDFAEELMMPRAELTRFWAAGMKPFYIAEKFGVDETMLKSRLGHLNLI